MPLSKRMKVVLAIKVAEIICDFDESESEEMAIGLMANHKLRKERNCIKNYMETICTYTLDEFKGHFRLTRNTCEHLMGVLFPHMKQKECFGRPQHPMDKQVLLFLWFMANQEVFRAVADRFDVAKSTAWDYVNKITDVLVAVSNNHIVWPSGRRQIECIEGFKSRANFPGVMGAVDGCHFRISPPIENANSYINRNKYHSIQLQGVCDHQYLFIDCFVGYPGSVHDARVFRNSPLVQHLNTFLPTQHLLGDSAYPNLANILTPFRENGHLTALQKNYNVKHSKTRCAIEQTFGYLKGRFRMLRHIIKFRTDLIPKLILSACVLHNIAFQLGDDDVEPAPLEEMVDEEVHDNGRVNTDGNRKRNAIMRQLYIHDEL